MRNFMEEIENMHVDEMYDITLEEYRAIYEASKWSTFITMHNFFLVGYLQGKRAGIHETRKAQA